jgi:hypothetical protein
MASTTLQHPMNTYRVPTEFPQWFIVLRDAKVIRFGDLKTLKDFAREELEGTNIEYQSTHITSILRGAWKRLRTTDIWVLENKAGTKLYFCKASFQHKRAYIRKVKEAR